MSRKYFLMLALTLVSHLSIYAQVTIGADKAPESFSTLQLEGKIGGLRLNNLTTAERDTLKVAGKPSANGLVIYNTEKSSIEMWNGVRWVTVSPLVAANGLFMINDTIRLGGRLQTATTIDLGTNNLNLTATTGSVGIGTSSPKAKLDVEGNVRIGETSVMPSNVAVLLRNNTSGIIGTAEQLTLQSQDIESGLSGTIDISPAFSSMFATLVVSSSNTCNRQMNAIFDAMIAGQDTGISLAYRNSMVKEVVGDITKNNPYNYSVTYSNVTGCIDGGDETQFDFTIDTSVPKKITITNNGNTTRRYTVFLSQAL